MRVCIEPLGMLLFLLVFSDLKKINWPYTKAYSKVSASIYQTDLKTMEIKQSSLKAAKGFFSLVHKVIHKGTNQGTFDPIVSLSNWDELTK